MSEQSRPHNHAWLEKHCPGYFDAWVRDVDRPAGEFCFGYTGGAAKHPRRAVAHSIPVSASSDSYERLNVGDGKWVKR